MNKLKELFFGSKQDKLTDKAFTQSIAVSVISILLCVVALCSVTWAWFSEGVSSSTNSIQSANCDVSVSVTSDGTTVETVDGEYTFIKDKAYEITITAAGTAESAYCILNIDGTRYYTVQIPTTATETVPNHIKFTLQFSADKTDVEIITRWGTSSQEKRDFADGLYYLNCEATDPANLVAEPTQTEAPENGESAESTETVPPSQEVTE